jgi:excisionase family DNA binding protein
MAVQHLPPSTTPGHQPKTKPDEIETHDMTMHMEGEQLHAGNHSHPRQPDYRYGYTVAAHALPGVSCPKWEANWYVVALGIDLPGSAPSTDAAELVGQLGGSRRIIPGPTMWRLYPMPDLRLLAASPPAERSTTVLDSGTVAFSIDEVAHLLRINRKTVTAMIDRGELAGVRYARRRWVPAHALRALLLLDIPGEASSASSS